MVIDGNNTKFLRPSGAWDTITYTHLTPEGLLWAVLSGSLTYPGAAMCLVRYIETVDGHTGVYRPSCGSYFSSTGWGAFPARDSHYSNAVLMRSGFGRHRDGGEVNSFHHKADIETKPGNLHPMSP